MAKKVILLAVVLLGMASVLFAEDNIAPPGEVKGVFDITYASKYIWRGFNIYGSHGVIQPSIDLDWFGSGFGTKLKVDRAVGVGFRNVEQGSHGGERWDYTLYYGGKMGAESDTLASMYRVSYVYYNNSNEDDEDFDLQELNCALSWPNLTGVKGLVPTYILVKLWPAYSGSLVGSHSPAGGTASGFAHIFMLDYGMAIPGLMPETPQQILNLHSEVIYNDGAGPGGQNVDHDWSNAVIGVTTDFETCKNSVLTPGLFYQISMDSSVNDKDELWCSLSWRYKF